MKKITGLFILISFYFLYNLFCNSILFAINGSENEYIHDDYQSIEDKNVFQRFNEKYHLEVPPNDVMCIGYIVRKYETNYLLFRHVKKIDTLKVYSSSYKRSG